MVGASGFEPPTSWSITNNPCKISNLAVLLTVAKNCAKVLVFKGFREVRARALATARDPSMQGVGTKMGTVVSPRRNALIRLRTLGDPPRTAPTKPTKPCHADSISSGAGTGSAQRQAPENWPPGAPGSPMLRRKLKSGASRNSRCLRTRYTEGGDAEPTTATAEGVRATAQVETEPGKAFLPAWLIAEYRAQGFSFDHDGRPISSPGVAQK